MDYHASLKAFNLVSRKLKIQSESDLRVGLTDCNKSALGAETMNELFCGRDVQPQDAECVYNKLPEDLANITLDEETDWGGDANYILCDEALAYTISVALADLTDSNSSTTESSLGCFNSLNMNVSTDSQSYCESDFDFGDYTSEDYATCEIDGKDFVGMDDLSFKTDNESDSIGSCISLDCLFDTISNSTVDSDHLSEVLDQIECPNLNSKFCRKHRCTMEIGHKLPQISETSCSEISSEVCKVGMIVDSGIANGGGWGIDRGDPDVFCGVGAKYRRRKDSKAKSYLKVPNIFSMDAYISLLGSLSEDIPYYREKCRERGLASAQLLNSGEFNFPLKHCNRPFPIIYPSTQTISDFVSF